MAQAMQIIAQIAGMLSGQSGDFINCYNGGSYLAADFFQIGEV